MRARDDFDFVSCRVRAGWTPVRIRARQEYTGPRTDSGQAYIGPQASRRWPGYEETGVHEHGSATRPRTGGFDAAAPAAGRDGIDGFGFDGLGASRELGERDERDEFGERDGLGGAADGRRGNGRGLGPTAFWFCGGFGGDRVRGHFGFCFGSGHGFCQWPGPGVRLGSGLRFRSGFGDGSGFRFEGRAGDAGWAEQAWCVEYFECVGRVECAGDAGCVDERWDVGTAACFGRPRARATGGGGCAATERRYGYGCVGVG